MPFEMKWGVHTLFMPRRQHRWPCKQTSSLPGRVTLSMFEVFGRFETCEKLKGVISEPHYHCCEATEGQRAPRFVFAASP